MLIGDMAERAGTSTRALRYYEAHGLLRTQRSANGYRLYHESELRVIREIKALLAVGFDLDDVRPFVACLRAGNSSGDVCPDSVAVLRRKLGEVEAGITRLGAVRLTLQTQLSEAIAHRAARCGQVCGTPDPVSGRVEGPPTGSAGLGPDGCPGGGRA